MKFLAFLLIVVSTISFSCKKKCTLCTKTDEKNRTFAYQEYCGNKKQVKNYEENLVKTAEEKTTITCIAKED